MSHLPTIPQRYPAEREQVAERLLADIQAERHLGRRGVFLRRVAMAVVHQVVANHVVQAVAERVPPGEDAPPRGRAGGPGDVVVRQPHASAASRSRCGVLIGFMPMQPRSGQPWSSLTISRMLGRSAAYPVAATDHNRATQAAHATARTRYSPWLATNARFFASFAAFCSICFCKTV